MTYLRPSLISISFASFALSALSCLIIFFGLSLGSAWAAGDAAQGEKAFSQCAACHAVGPGAKHNKGPELNNIVGAKAGSKTGFTYSRSMIEAGEKGLSWTEDKLNLYLTKPKKFIPGTTTSLSGIRNGQQRLDLIAYLKSFSGQ